MHSFILKLNAETRDELYADIGIEFMGFILIEAIHNILVAGQPGVLEIEDDLTRIHKTDESQFDVSVDYLIDIVQEFNEANGIVLSDEYYRFNSEYHDQFATKLADAIVSIEDSNDFTEIMALQPTFNDPAIVKGFKFTAYHYPDRVLFLVYPANTPTPQASLADLIFDPPGTEGSIELTPEAQLAEFMRRYDTN